MTSEVVIDVQQKDISIALMEDKQLVEYQNEPREASFSVGNIYIAKVKKLMPGLNACFVDVGYERDAFLHYLDLGSHFNSYQKYLKQVQSDRKKLLVGIKMTERNFSHSLKPAKCLNWKRTAAYRMYSKQDRKCWYKS